VGVCVCVSNKACGKASLLRGVLASRDQHLSLSLARAGSLSLSLALSRSLSLARARAWHVDMNIDLMTLVPN